MRTKQERLMDVIGNTNDRNVAIAVGAESGDTALKTETKHVQLLTPEKVSKKDVRRFWAGRIAALSAAAVLLIGGAGYLFGVVRIQDRITPYKPAYSESEHSASWKPAKEATGMEWTQLTDAQKAFDGSAVKADADAKLREFNVHALWYKFDGRTLILRYDVEYTGWWSISPDMAGFSQLPSIWTFSFRTQADAMNAGNYDQDAYRGAVTDVIGIDRNVWELACRIEFDKPREETDLYAIKGYNGVNNYDDPYLLTAKRYIPQGVPSDAPETTDPLAVYSDFSMPEPFEAADEVVYGGTLHSKFYDLWQTRFTRTDDAVKEAVGQEKYEELFGKYQQEQLADNEAGNVTHYRLEDTTNIYRLMKDAGLSGEEMEAALEKADEINKPQVLDGKLSHDILYDLDTACFGFDNKEDIALAYKSEYAIAVGEYVFSPRWMYYHTVEDYEKAGISATQAELMLPSYEKLGLKPEAWDAFRNKLDAYITYYGKKSEERIYPIPDDYYSVTSDEGIKILEDHFYGRWERTPVTGGDYDELIFTYNYDYKERDLLGFDFDFEGSHRPFGFAETDDIWCMMCINGGESEIFVIEKSAPDVMYITGAVYYNGYNGAAAVDLANEMASKYERDKLFICSTEVRVGELSAFGQYRLTNMYGEEFANFFYDTLINGFVDEFGIKYVEEGGIPLPKARRYLVGRTDDSLTLGIRFYKEYEYRTFLDDMENEPEPVEYYFAVTFTRTDDNGWTFGYGGDLGDVYADVPTMTYRSSVMDRFLTEVELRDVNLRGDHIAFQSGTVTLTDTMSEESVPAAAELSTGMAGLYGYSCGKDIRVGNYYGGEGKILVDVAFPISDNDGWLVSLYWFDGDALRKLHFLNGGALEPHIIAKDSIGIENGIIYVTDSDGYVVGYSVGEDGETVTEVSRAEPLG